jgi:Dyp-type peroxidase family
MARLKWFEKVDAAQARVRAAAQAHQPLGAFDFDSLIEKSWLKQRISRFMFRQLFPALLALLRTFSPVFRWGRLVIVSRYEDVKIVLDNEDGDFPVIYSQEMEELSGGTQGVLGLDGAAHCCLRRRLERHLTAPDMRAHDIEKIRIWSRENANALLDAGGGEIDVCRDLITRTASEVCCRYMGLELHDPDAFGEWGMALSMLLFGDPLGDETIGAQGRIGSAHLRSLIDDAIDRQENNRGHTDKKSPEELAKVAKHRSLIFRLLIVEKMPRDLVRATIFGLATGFVPTNTLAAGNILEELLTRPALMARAKAAALHLAACRELGEPQAEADAIYALEAVLLEAAGRNPALSPGVWRWCTTGGTIRRRDGTSVEIRPGSMMMVSILSALRDRRMPAAIRRDPHKAACLMFGYGPHQCLGAEMALVQITEVFAALLTRPGLERATGTAGRMVRAGPFPVQCTMRWTCETAKRALIVIALPVRSGVELTVVEEALDRIGNPACADFAKALDETGCISLMSINVIEREAGSAESILLFEINGDGDETRLLHIFANAVSPWIGPVLAHCTPDGDEPSSPEAMATLLKEGIQHLHRKPWGATGLHYDGLSEFSVADIDRQQRLGRAARELVESYLKNGDNLNRGMRAMHLLIYVRRIFKGDRITMLPKPNRDLYKAIDPDVRLGIVRPSRKRLSIADWHWPRSVFDPLWPMLQGRDSRAFVASILITWIVSGFSLLFWLHPEAKPKLMAFAAAVRDAVLHGVKALISALSQGSLSERLGGAFGWLDATVQHGFGLIWTALLDSLAHGWGWVTLLFTLVPILFARGPIRKVGGAVLTGLALTYGWPLATLVLGGLASTLVLFSLVAAAFALAIRFKEMTDKSDGRIADFDHVRAIAAKENPPGYEHNHVLVVMPFKQGLTRKLSFAFVMWGIKQAVTYWFRPGYVVTMGTIHKARWLRIKGTQQFLFFSNYDGSWESYLEDFITRAHPGQSAAWSHGVGFPPTRFLIKDGARDGDRFKRWMRRQQVVTRVWYSRFPDLTLKQIHHNAMIEDGLARAANDTDAKRWLSHFGSAQREMNELETNESQSLVFTGFGKMRHATALLVRLPDSASDTALWLKGLALLPEAINHGNPPKGRLSFGDVPHDETALVLGFSAQGLQKAGLADGEGLEELPATFRMGMAGRVRELGDPDAAGWRWTDAENGADAVLMVYHHDPLPADKDRQDPGHPVVSQIRYLTDCRGEVLHHIPCAPVQINGEEQPNTEHFGFRDGISQPVIRGTRRGSAAVPERDLLSPGEFLLGYQNDQGYVSPSITVGSQLDPASNLPTLAESRVNRFPFFGNRNSDPERRDFGRNGTFLVLRQLDQDVDGFEAEMAQKAKELDTKFPRLGELLGRPVDADWLSAKVIGRWKDGTSLVASPHCPLGAIAPDNDFAYGVDDPRGLACPLGSHIRRTNPRDSLEPGDADEQRITNRHRLLRRGRSYDYDVDRKGENRRGLLFAALCSDLDRQFEFVQTHWAQARTFHALTDEADPLLGHPDAEGGAFTESGPRPTRFTVPSPVGPVTVEGLQSYVTMRGGGYFFLPSRSAISHLISRLQHRTG